MSLKKIGDKYSAFNGDNNDCCIRALSIAANKPYAECSELFEAAGRKKNRRTSFYVSNKVYNALGLQYLVTDERKTLTQFIKKHPTGRFVIIRSGHAFAVVDGVVHDWNGGKTGPRSRVVQAWRV